MLYVQVKSLHEQLGRFSSWSQVLCWGMFSPLYCGHEIQKAIQCRKLHTRGMCQICLQINTHRYIPVHLVGNTDKASLLNHFIKNYKLCETKWDESEFSHTSRTWSYPTHSVKLGISPYNIRVHWNRWKFSLDLAKAEPNLPGAICPRKRKSHPVGMGRLVLDRLVECLESQAGKAVLAQQPRIQQHTTCLVWKLISVAHQSCISNVTYLTLVLLMT